MFRSFSNDKGLCGQFLNEFLTRSVDGKMSVVASCRWSNILAEPRLFAQSIVSFWSNCSGWRIWLFFFFFFLVISQACELVTQLPICKASGDIFRTPVGLQDVKEQCGLGRQISLCSGRARLQCAVGAHRDAHCKGSLPWSGHGRDTHTTPGTRWVSVSFSPCCPY